MTGKPSPKANLISSNYLWLAPRGDWESQLSALGKSKSRLRKTDDVQMRLVLLLIGFSALMPVAYAAADAGNSALECPSPSQVNNPQIKREVAGAFTLQP